jgi:tetratricopeptide (TPR) repeat protein
MTTQISDVAMIRHAQKYFAERRFNDATVFCQDLLRRIPNHYQAIVILIDIFWYRREQDQAFAFAKRLVRAFPKDGPAHAKLAWLYNNTGRHKDAISLLEKFRKKSPSDLAALSALARSHEYAGDLDTALSLIEPLVESGAATPDIAHDYARIKFEQKQYDEVIEIESRNIHSQGVPPGTLEAMCFLLGRTYEATRDYDKAFAAYSAANSVLPPEDKHERTVQRHDSVIEAFSAQWMKRLPRARNESRLPVFIICRPRSGSTLVERIIAAHPAVYAGGELDILQTTADRLNLTIGSTAPYPQCVHDVDQNDADQLGTSFLQQLQELDPAAQRVTNKHLWSWEHLGLLALICPKAVVIDLRRDPVDNGVAIFTAHMHASQSYSRDLRQIGLDHKEYERMMDHWYSVLDLPILKVNYEDIVADQEAASRRIIEFCGLPWDDACLRFYESASPVRTLSYDQVTRPIYTSSVGRHKPFERHLGPLREAIAEGSS